MSYLPNLGKVGSGEVRLGTYGRYLKLTGYIRHVMNPLADRPPPPFTTRTRYLVKANIHGDSGKRMKELQRVSLENTVISH